MVVVAAFGTAVLPFWWMIRHRPGFAVRIHWGWVALWALFVAGPFILAPDPPWWIYLFPLVVSPIGTLAAVLKWQIINPDTPSNN